MTDIQEQLLLRRIKHGQDKKAADTLIRKYYEEVYAYVYRQIGEKQQAMDITQDIFLSMLQTVWNYDSKKAKFRTWLYSIATHKVVDFYRSREYRKELQSIDVALPIAMEFDLEREVTDKELVERIFEYLHTQDTCLEKIFRLKFYGEYTFSQIGQALGIPESTVKTKYYTAIKNIKNNFLTNI